MVMACICKLTKCDTMDSSLTTKNKGMVYMCGLMGPAMKATGTKGNRMVLEHTITKTSK